MFWFVRRESRVCVVNDLSGLRYRVKGAYQRVQTKLETFKVYENLLFSQISEDSFVNKIYNVRKKTLFLCNQICNSNY